MLTILYRKLSRERNEESESGVERSGSQRKGPSMTWVSRRRTYHLSLHPSTSFPIIHSSTQFPIIHSSTQFCYASFTLVDSSTNEPLLLPAVSQRQFSHWVGVNRSFSRYVVRSSTYLCLLFPTSAPYGFREQHRKVLQLNSQERATSRKEP